MTERANLADKVKINAEEMCQLAEEREIMTRNMVVYAQISADFC